MFVRDKLVGERSLDETQRLHGSEETTPDCCTVQGYLDHKNSLPQDPTAGLRLGPYGGPRGVGVSDERGTPANAAAFAPWLRAHHDGETPPPVTGARGGVWEQIHNLSDFT